MPCSRVWARTIFRGNDDISGSFGLIISSSFLNPLQITPGKRQRTTIFNSMEWNGTLSENLDIFEYNLKFPQHKGELKALRELTNCTTVVEFPIHHETATCENTSRKWDEKKLFFGGKFSLQSQSPDNNSAPPEVSPKWARVYYLCVTTRITQFSITFCKLLFFGLSFLTLSSSSQNMPSRQLWCSISISHCWCLEAWMMNTAKKLNRTNWGELD